MVTYVPLNNAELAELDKRVQLGQPISSKAARLLIAMARERNEQSTNMLPPGLLRGALAQ